MAKTTLFTLEEQTVLRRLYPKGSWEKILETFPHHTRKQINSWAVHNNVFRETEQAKKVSAKRGANGTSSQKRRASKEVTLTDPVVTAPETASKKKDGPGPIGKMVEEMKKLAPSHPRRLAYAQAARSGNGLDAFNAWNSWPKQQERVQA